MTNPQAKDSIIKRVTNVARLQWRTPRTTPEDAIRAVLLELAEPTKGMLDAATAHHQFIGHPEAKQSSIDRQLNGYRLAADDYWRAMVKHILSGGK